METTIRIGNRPVDSIEERTAAMLGLAGIELATTRCDALLHVEAVGGRATASYTGIGVCGVGIDIDGEATIEVSGETRTWTLAREAPPPPTALSACPSRPNDAIPASSWYHDLVVGPLADVFGPRIEAAAWMTQAMEQDHPRVPDQAASTIALEGLRGEYGEDALGLVASWVQEHPDHELLGDLVPYLIEGFASHPDDADFHWVLSHITGEQLENGRPTYDWEPGDWYEWWIEQ